MHDWSMLHLKHQNKQEDRLQRTHQHDAGYELQLVG